MNKTAFLPIFSIIIYLLSAINPIYCQDNDKNGKYGFSIGTGFGVLYGQAFEYVYPYNGETKGEFLSELTWDMKPVCYVGFNADFGLTDILSKPGFFSSLAIKAGIPVSSGNLEDRDWMSSVNSNLTHFSKHENKTNELVWIDFSVGASLPIKYLYIKPFISGSWMRFSFAGRNGYFQHSKENPSGSGIYDPIETINKELVKGKVISYLQDWLFLAAGCSIGTNILAPFSFDLSFQISPLTYCAATDNHYYLHFNGTYYVADTNSKVFNDFTDFGLFLEPKGSISFDLKNIKFLLEASYRYISKTKGESYTNNYHSQNKVGAGLSVMDYQFLINMTF
ncbi:omptin family outer membrane protease [Treponema sp. R80B11-R83G3]